MTFLRNFWKDEQGQDLIEYTLLMAFVALASAALFLGAGNSIKGIWTTTNSQLAAANATAAELDPRAGHAGVLQVARRVPGLRPWPVKGRSGSNGTCNESRKRMRKRFGGVPDRKVARPSRAGGIPLAGRTDGPMRSRCPRPAPVLKQWKGSSMNKRFVGVLIFAFVVDVGASCTYRSLLNRAPQTAKAARPTVQIVLAAKDLEVGTVLKDETSSWRIGPAPSPPGRPRGQVRTWWGAA